MSTRVFLLRHGATQLSAEDRFAGETDVALSDAGRQQLSRLSIRLSTEPIRAVYASPLSRTMESGRIISKPHALDVIPVDGLREISHGRWEGKTRAEVEEELPEEYSRWESDPYSFAPEKGESGLAVMARALPALLRIIEAHRGEHVAVASHKATIRLLLSSLMGFDARTYRDRLDQSVAALNIVDFNDHDHPRLTLFNDTSHLAETPSCVPSVPKQRLSRYWDRTRK